MEKSGGKKHGGDLEKDGLKWEKKREGVSGAMGWLRAGRQSEVGDELWVVTAALWDRAGTYVLRKVEGFCEWLGWRHCVPDVTGGVSGDCVFFCFEGK